MLMAKLSALEVEKDKLRALQVTFAQNRFERDYFKGSKLGPDVRDQLTPERATRAEEVLKRIVLCCVGPCWIYVGEFIRKSELCCMICVCKRCFRCCRRCGLAAKPINWRLLSSLDLWLWQWIPACKRAGTRRPRRRWSSCATWLLRVPPTSLLRAKWRRLSRTASCRRCWTSLQLCCCTGGCRMCCDQRMRCTGCLSVLFFFCFLRRHIWSLSFPFVFLFVCFCRSAAKARVTIASKDADSSPSQSQQQQQGIQGTSLTYAEIRDILAQNEALQAQVTHMRNKHSQVD